MSNGAAEDWQGVIVVEDDRSLREVLTSVLTHEGHDARSVGDAESLLAEVPPAEPALVILDVNLPGMDGVECCRTLRDRGHAGSILMLTARHEVRDRVSGLDAGADDYLVKPFALDELLARVRSMLRRHGDHGAPAAAVGDEVLELADLSIEMGTRRVRRAGTDVELTKLEFDLLALLVTNSPNVLTREVLHDRVWGHDGSFMSNSLEVAVSHLRRKLAGDDLEPLIHTVRGVGYVARTS